MIDVWYPNDFYTFIVTGISGTNFRKKSLLVKRLMPTTGGLLRNGLNAAVVAQLRSCVSIMDRISPAGSCSLVRSYSVASYQIAASWCESHITSRHGAASVPGVDRSLDRPTVDNTRTVNRAADAARHRSNDVESYHGRSRRFRDNGSCTANGSTACGNNKTEL